MIPTRPSLQGRFSLVYSGDPALQPRPADLAKDASPAEHKERSDLQAKHDHDLTVCRETGVWTALVIPGATPTVFSFELPKGEAKRALADLVTRLRDNNAVLASRLFRATLQDVTNWPQGAPELQYELVDGMRLVADKVISFLDDEVTPRVIGELSGLVYERLIGALSGK